MRPMIIYLPVSILLLMMFAGCPPETIDDYFNIMLPKEIKSHGAHRDLLLNCSMGDAKALIADTGKSATLDDVEIFNHRAKRILSAHNAYLEGDEIISFNKVSGNAGSPIWAHIFTLSLMGYIKYKIRHAGAKRYRTACSPIQP